MEKTIFRSYLDYINLFFHVKLGSKNFDRDANNEKLYSSVTDNLKFFNFIIYEFVGVKKYLVEILINFTADNDELRTRIKISTNSQLVYHGLSYTTSNENLTRNV